MTLSSPLIWWWSVSKEIFIETHREEAGKNLYTGLKWLTSFLPSFMLLIKEESLLPWFLANTESDSRWTDQNYFSIFKLSLERPFHSIHIKVTTSSNHWWKSGSNRNLLHTVLIWEIKRPTAMIHPVRERSARIELPSSPCIQVFLPFVLSKQLLVRVKIVLFGAKIAVFAVLLQYRDINGPNGRCRSIFILL